MIVQLKINDAPRELAIDPGATLLDALRDAGYLGVKRGCEAGTCGSCVVLVDGQPHYSCLLFAAAMEGRSLTTIEACDSDDLIISAFADGAAVQCGYCVPGMVLSTKALLRENPDPTEEQIRRALDGHLCRCTGYVKQIKAVLRAAELTREVR
jgi:carbon-monoxide dehydrogenase small subunit